MKSLLTLAIILTMPVAIAGNMATQSPLTMEQLMNEPRIQGGNFSFDFDTPVYGRIIVTTTEYPEGPKKVEFFDTATAQKHIELFSLPLHCSWATIQEVILEAIRRRC